MKILPLNENMIRKSVKINKIWTSDIVKFELIDIYLKEINIEINRYLTKRNKYLESDN